MKEKLIFLYNKHNVGNTDSYITNIICAKLILIYNKHNAGKTNTRILLRARRNEKEMKVKPATSFKLLTVFIHKK